MHVDCAEGLTLHSEWTIEAILPWQDSTWYVPCKRAIDFVLSLLLFLLTGPLVLALMLLVRLTSRGPAIYSQTRLGKGGRRFTIYKIRTMVHNCEQATGARRLAVRALQSARWSAESSWVAALIARSTAHAVPARISPARRARTAVAPAAKSTASAGQAAIAFPGAR